MTEAAARGAAARAVRMEGAVTAVAGAVVQTAEGARVAAARGAAGMAASKAMLMEGGAAVARGEAGREAAEKGAAGGVARVAAPAPAPAGWDVPGSSHGRRQPRRRIRSSKPPESCCSL